MARAAVRMAFHKNTARMALSSFGNDIEQHSIPWSEAGIAALVPNIVGALEITDYRPIVRLCANILVFLKIFS